eukprot:scaffold2931_cov154-Isochrysis_galbana.AAC.5
MMTDPPTYDTEAREPDAPDPTDAKHHAPFHGHTGGVPSAFRQGTHRRTRCSDMDGRTAESGRAEGEGRAAPDHPQMKPPQPQPPDET